MRTTRPTTTRTTPAVTLLCGAVAAALMLASCDRAGTPSSTPATPAAAPSTASGPAAATPAITDWSKVTPVDAGEAILAYKTLARRADAWHNGATPTITIRHDGVSAATDQSGNKVFISPQAWKGVIDQVRGSTAPTIAVASKAAFYADPQSPHKDSFGTLARYTYRLEAVADNELRFHNEGKRDDGV